MLGWLTSELESIEKANGTAIMIAHVPNLDECNRQYGRRYHAILDRFQHIIRFGMYSHIHQEQYQVLRDMVQKVPIGMNFIVGSATTFTAKRQSFNVVYVDPVTMLPVEFLTYAFDLDYANKYDEPKWYLEFNYTRDYEMPDLSPKSFFEHSEQIYYNETIARQYRNQRNINSPVTHPESVCNEDCRRVMYCQTVSNDYDESQYCLDKDRLQPFSLNALVSLENVIDHAWYTKKN